MAAVTLPDVDVRAARPGEGRAIAALWRELWDAHEAWGGYAGARDPRVYDAVASRLEQDALVRAGQPALGRHVHLIASVRGVVSGQVEGWFERHGVDGATPFTCEVRSLIVSEGARCAGAGRALLDGLASIARQMSRGAPVVLAAEVLEPNPAHAFYRRVGYAPVSWSARIEASDVPQTRAGEYSARVGEPRDALPIAMLESTLAARRRAAGDLRFDRPRGVDATLVGAIASHLARSNEYAGNDPLELVVTDAQGVVRGVASFAVSSLEPPFVPIKRAMVGRFALDAARESGPMIATLVALGARIAQQRGAVAIELTDLSAPGSPLYSDALAIGAEPWSRVVLHSPA